MSVIVNKLREAPKPKPSDVLALGQKGTIVSKPKPSDFFSPWTVIADPRYGESQAT